MYDEELSGFADFLLDFIREDIQQRCAIFEAFNLSQFGRTRRVNYIVSELNGTGSKSVQKDWMRDIIYLPFENIQIPVPAEYDKILTQCYGDYHQLIQGISDHEEVIFDPDISYRDYFSRHLI